jgi:hypothetical protein
MEDLVKQLVDTKGVASSTANLYIRTLTAIHGGPFKSLAFLRKKEAVHDRLKTYAESTQKSMLTAIVSVLSLVAEKPTYKSIHAHYHAEMMSRIKTERSKDTSEPSQKQKENWMSWKEVEQLHKDLETTMKSLGKKKTLTPSESELLLRGMILSLYVLVPPRRNQDYLKMMVVKSFTDDLPKDCNYLDLAGKRFIFASYKTSKKYGTQEVSVPPELGEVVDAYLKHHAPFKQGKGKHPVPFLVHGSGDPLTAVNAITRVLNRIFGKKVGSSMLRHIYLTDKYGKINDEQKEDSHAMAHSLSEQRAYVKEIGNTP